MACGTRDCAAGGDTRVSGVWTVEGAVPTSASCADVCIDTVRLVVNCGSGATNLDALTAPCVSGHIATPGGVLAAGTYDVAWEGLSAGAVVVRGGHQSITAVADDIVTIPGIDFSSGYDPSGTDATLSAHWTIHGGAPTAATCEALGIARVRVAIFHGSRVIELARLTGTCESGAIDTRPIAVLAAGDVVLQLQALGSDGTVLFSGAMATEHVGAGPTHVALYDDVPVDFASSTFDPHGSDAAIDFAWTLDTQAASIDVCDSVDADTIALVLYAADDTARTSGVTLASGPCRTGTYASGSPIVSAGSYLVSIEALDAGGTMVASTNVGTTPLVVAAGAPWVVPPTDLSFPTTLTVTLDWGDPSTGAASTCTAVGVTAMGYTLSDHVTHASIAQQDGLPCTQRLSFDGTTSVGLVTGSYDLAVHGTGMHTWHTTATECVNLPVTTGRIAWSACLVETP